MRIRALREGRFIFDFGSRPEYIDAGEAERHFDEKTGQPTISGAGRP